MAPKTSSTKPLRVAILASSNMDLLPRYLQPQLKGLGLAPEFYIGGFSQFRQEILQGDSGYYAFNPDFTILFWEARDLLAPLIERPLDYGPAERRSEVTSLVVEASNLTKAALERLPGQVLFVNDLAAPSVTSLGLLEGNTQWSVKEAVTQFNASLREAIKGFPGRALLVGYEDLVAKHGQDNWYDPRLWYLARCRLGRSALEALAKRYVSCIKASLGMRKKVLVLDLDNTLWGGIVGEDGLEGIHLGTEGVGLAYREFQNEIMSLYKQGIVLAINSKNNPEDAMEALEKHPYMVLRPNHFASMQINWLDKETNMRAIAEELELGLDSFVFLDDSPVERELIRQRLPQVLTPEPPQDPSLLPSMLLELDAFNTFGLTSEDRKRGEMYYAQTLRRQLERTSPSLEDFYRTLEMRAFIRPVDAFSLPRAAQMTQRTNQFNLTTRRYTEAQLSSMAADPAWRLYTLGLEDRFGDNGLVGLTIVRTSKEVWHIDTLLMSCRVLGRTVETALLGYLAKEAKGAGARYLRGEYIPTAKNGLARDLYARHGFQNQGDSFWTLDLEKQEIQLPEWIGINL